MPTRNPLVANAVVNPIDRTAANPSMSFGATDEQNSGTGIYGDFDSISMAIAGNDVLSLDADGIQVSSILVSAIKILSGEGAPTIEAPVNSLYVREDASSLSEWLYRNTDGEDGWEALTDGGA